MFDTKIIVSVVVATVLTNILLNTVLKNVDVLQPKGNLDGEDDDLM